MGFKLWELFWSYVHTYICMFVCTCIYKYIYIYIYTHTYIYMIYNIDRSEFFFSTQSPEADNISCHFSLPGHLFSSG